MGDPADMLVTYQSLKYRPEDVAGTYVRLASVPSWAITERPFLIAECLALPAKAKTKIGHGATIREYRTGGADIPEAVKARAREAGRSFIEWGRAL